MIRAGLKLLTLYFAVWVLSTQWDTANVLYRQAVAAILGLSAAPGITLIFLAFATVAVLWQLLGLACWVLNVPASNTHGPTAHALPDRPLRVQLRLRPSRFLAGFVLTLFGFLLSLRALEALLPGLPVPLPAWLAELRGHDPWIVYGVVHAAVAGLGWAALQGYARSCAGRQTRSYGFVRYHVQQSPVARYYVRVVALAHFPLAAFAATSHPHELHLLVVLASLGAVLLSALLAQKLVMGLERRRDRWLFDLEREAARTGPLSEAHELWSRSVQFLQPGAVLVPRDLPPDRAAEVGAAPREETPPPTPVDDERVGDGPSLGANLNTGPGTGETDLGAGETALGAGDPVPGASPGQDAGDVDYSAPHAVAARILAEGIASLEAGDLARARALLQDAARVGDTATRERAETLLRRIPRARTALWVTGSALAGLAAMLLVVIGWEWFNLPSGDETRRLARSAHIHVRKLGEEAGGAVLTLLGNRYDYSLNTRLENVSGHFVNAVIASEDHRFRDHGVSYKVAKFAQAGVLCVARKLNPFAASRACRGNSTLTQQLARNLFLSESRSIRRKLTELLWAIKMETELEKDEILELYMNRIYLGKGNFGVEMAARDYFGKTAAQLTLDEAVYLAAAVKRPGWNWHQDRAGAERRARLILALMRRHGYVPGAHRLPEPFRPKRGRRQPHRPYLGHLWQWVRADVREVMRALPDGDYKVLTSIDAEVQVYAERHLANELRRLQAAGIEANQGALVTMRPDGAVLAMVGGIGESVTARGFNRAKRTRGLHSRPPASSFKPFVYLAALEAGLDPDSIIDARPVSIPIAGAPRPYEPQNHDGKSYGAVTMREALVRSINTAAVRMLHDRLGFERLFETIERLGIDTSDFNRQWGIALGQAGVPLIEMVGAYGVFASRGRKVQPHAVLAITTEYGKTVWRRDEPTSARAFRARDIDRLNEMLREVVKSGTGRRAARRIPDGYEIAGKTGTGDGFVDAWFLGFTEDVVLGVWIGNDRPQVMPGVYGGTAPARVFNAVLRDLVRYTEVL